MDFDALLSQTNLLSGLSVTSMRRITDALAVRTVPRNTTLFLERQEGESLFVLVSGSVKLQRVSDEGREVVVNVVQPGEMFAEVILFEDSRYPVTAVAAEESQVIEIPRRKVHELLAEEDFRNEFLGGVMRKLRFLVDQVYVLTSCDVRERFLRFLRRRYGHRERYRLAVPKKDIAAVLGTTPETLSRTLTDLQDDGYINMQGRELWVSAAAWQDFWIDDGAERE
jgi:CRP/FNR family transcriptional regulator